LIQSSRDSTTNSLDLYQQKNTCLIMRHLALQYAPVPHTFYALPMTLFSLMPQSPLPTLLLQFLAYNANCRLLDIVTILYHFCRHLTSSHYILSFALLLLQFSAHNAICYTSDVLKTFHHSCRHLTSLHYILSFTSLVLLTSLALLTYNPML